MRSKLPLKSIIIGAALFFFLVFTLGRHLGKRDEESVIARHGVRLAMTEADVLRSLGEPTKRMRDSASHEIWGYSGQRAVEFSHGVVVNTLGFNGTSNPAPATPAPTAPTATPDANASPAAPPPAGS